MRRILVPLDGSHFAASILPDAMRLAGEDGTLILIRDAAHPMYDQELGESSRRFAVEQALAYLKGKAREIEQHGVKVEVHVLSLLDPVTAINEATQLYKADMMAVAMHGYGPMGRLVHNDIAWKAVTNSSVPVLLASRGGSTCPDLDLRSTPPHTGAAGWIGVCGTGVGSGAGVCRGVAGFPLAGSMCSVRLDPGNAPRPRR